MDGDGDVETSKENLEILLDDSKKAKPKFADGGLIGKEVTFMSQGEKDRGIIGEVNEDGSLAVDTGRSLRLVEKYEIVEIHDKPKKRGFFFDNGGTIDAFQMRTVKGIDNNPTEILTDEQKVQFATGGGVDLNYDGYVPTYRITEIHTKDGKVFENVYSDSEVLSGIYYSDKPLRSKEPKNKNQMELFKKGGLPKTSFYIPRYNIDFIETEHVGKIQGNHIYGGVWIDMKKQFRLVEEAKKQGRFVNKPKFEVDELVYNKTTNSVGIVRIAEEKGEVKTDADGNVSVAELELYNPLKFKHQSKAKVAPSTLKEIDNRGLYKPYSYAGGGWVDGKYDKNKLLMLIGDDLLIRTDDGTELILYNPYSNNDDNRILWDSDDYVIGLVPNDGDEVKVRYEDIVSINKNPNYMIDGGSLGSQYVLIKSIGNYGMGTVGFLVSKKELNKIPFDTIQEKAEAFVNNKEDNFGEKSYRFDKLITNSKEIDDYAKGYNHSNYKVVLSNDEENYPDGFYITKSKDYLKFKDGGKTTFDEKATAIAKNFEGKKVKPKYQKEFGKTYDKAEAKEVGKRVAGSLKAKYDSKMSGGGKTKIKPKTASNNTMVLAKQIRKEGESWASALKRAKEQIRK
jgi:hypothetical protein